MDDWLKNLKAGDSVIVSNGWNDEIRSIEKVTQSGLIKVCGKLYDKYGRARGEHGYHINRLVQATEDRIQEIENNRMIIDVVYRMENILRNHDNLTVDQWRRIKAILDESGAK